MADVVARLHPARSACALIGIALAWLVGGASASSTPAPVASAASARSLAQPVRNDGVAWAKLSPAHRRALAPLEREWPQMDGSRKLKWIEIAQRMPSMQAEERERIQARMAEWARMTPAERGQARLRYMQARRIAPDDRGARWEDYQALSTDEKQQLAAKAAAPASAPGSTRKAVAERSARLDRADAKGPTAKSNLVTNPNFAAPPRAVAPTVIQARPGATTTLVSKPPTPPAHQQIGLPKIAASPSFVDRATLLPIRGAQGAATVSVNVPDADAEPVPRP